MLIISTYILQPLQVRNRNMTFIFLSDLLGLVFFFYHCFGVTLKCRRPDSFCFCLYHFPSYLSHDPPFHPPAVEGNTTLEFDGVQSKYLMSLDAKEKGVFYINCTGPYILYMDLCYMSMEGKEASGTLRLLDGKENPETLFTMNSSSEECKDTVLQKTVFIKEKGKARLQLVSRGRFKLKNLTVGLSSLLGRQCLF